MKENPADELSERYMATVNRLLDRKPLDAFARGVVKGAIRAAATEAIIAGRTSMHEDLLAEHRL